MTPQLDSGDIIAQCSFNLEGLYYNELYKKIIKITPKLVHKVLNFVNSTNALASPQKSVEATIFRNDREIHRKLDFNTMESQKLLNLVRAGRSYLFYNGLQIYIEQAVVVDNNRHMLNNIKPSPGTIVDINEDGVVVITLDQTFLIIKKVRWRIKSKKSSSWVKKCNMNIGEVLV
jgi:methionyl-tRNA formyltransferase